MVDWTGFAVVGLGLVMVVAFWPQISNALNIGGVPVNTKAPSLLPKFGIEPAADRPGHVTTGTAKPSGPCQCVGGIIQGDSCSTKGEFCSSVAFAYPALSVA